MPTTRIHIPRIFISHSKNFEFVMKLANDLSHVLDDKTAVWYDELGLRGGDNWWDTIEKEIKTRNIFILIATPDAFKSPWVKEELQIARIHKNSKPPKIDHILPLHVQECFNRAPEHLKLIQWLSFLPPETYYSAFCKLLESLEIPVDARIHEILRKLATIDTYAMQ